MLSRRRPTKTQWARYPIPVSGYEPNIKAKLKIAKIHRILHTIKFTRILICFELCLQSEIQRAPCAQQRIRIGTIVGLESHQLYDSQTAPIETQAQGKSYPLAKS